MFWYLFPRYFIYISALLAVGMRLCQAEPLSFRVVVSFAFPLIGSFLMGVAVLKAMVHRLLFIKMLKVNDVDPPICVPVCI